MTRDERQRDEEQVKTTSAKQQDKPFAEQVSEVFSKQ